MAERLAYQSNLVTRQQVSTAILRLPWLMCLTGVRHIFSLLLTSLSLSPSRLPDSK